MHLRRSERPFETLQTVFQPAATRYAPVCSRARELALRGRASRPTSRSRTAPTAGLGHTYRKPSRQSNGSPGTDRIVFAVIPSVDESASMYTVTDLTNRRHGCAGAQRRGPATSFGALPVACGSTSTIGSNVTIGDSGRNRRTNLQSDSRRRPDHAPAGRRNRAGPMRSSPSGSFSSDRRHHRVGSGDLQSLVDRPYTDAAGPLGYRRAAKPSIGTRWAPGEYHRRNDPRRTGAGSMRPARTST